MKILFLAFRPEINAGARYRVYKYIPYLEKAGIKCDVVPPFSNRDYYNFITPKNLLIRWVIISKMLFNRILQILKSNHYDVMFIQNEFLPFKTTLFGTIISILNKKIIYDFEDAYFSKKTEQIIKKSKYVIAGSNYLQSYALKYNKNVAVIPTSVDISRYQAKTDYESKNITIGWIGTPYGLNNLDLLDDVFNELKKNHAFTVKIVSSKNYAFESIKNINKKWRLEDEIDDLLSFDIGIMPLVNNEFNQGKCGFKLIQYLAVGVPVICSPIGVNKEIVQDGINGFWADTPDEWIKKLSLLIKNKELRISFGKKGRESIMDKYTIEKNHKNLISIIHKTFNS